MKKEIDEINSIMKQYLWMDFELATCSTGEAVLHGYIDEAGEDKIRITFSGVDTIVCKTCFTFDGERDFLEVLDGEDARNINLKYDVLQGNKIFRLINTNVEGDMYIIAKEVAYETVE